MTLSPVFYAILIFCLCVWIVAILPIPPGARYMRTVLYVLVACLSIGYVARLGGLENVLVFHRV